MRKISVAAICLTSGLAMAASACAPPEVVTDVRPKPGSLRSYKLIAISKTILESVAAPRSVSSELRADLEVLVVRSDEKGQLLKLTVETTRATRDGQEATLPPTQTVDVTIDSSGEIADITGDLRTDVGSFDPSSVDGLLGPVLPQTELKLGSSWTTDLPEGGTREGRVTTFGVVGSEATVILDLLTSRPVERTATFDGQPLTLIGEEKSRSQLERSLDDGTTVKLETSAVTTMLIRSGNLIGGTVTVTAKTQLEPA